MTDSFRRIDYSIRPAKYAERKMLSDIFRRLSAFSPLEEYRYVGFGSVWFSDFLLFHRMLGIKHMLSIEKAAASSKRFEANRPFNFDIDFRTSTEVLPDMGYDRRQFIWLDYDDPITTDMLRDAASIATRARSGTVLAVSVQCHRAPEVADADRDRANDGNALTAEERFKSRFQEFNIDPDITRAELGGWPFGELSRNMFLESIKSALEVRRLANPEDQVCCKVICNFDYEDGAKMTTSVLVFYSLDEESEFEACYFSNLDFLDAGDDPIYIPTPKLTVREFRMLESQLPLATNSELDMGFIPPNEAKGFVQMYRYFPNFAVIES
jgi:hypothetical protein